MGLMVRFLPNALHTLLEVSWGTGWNLFLHLQKTTELHSDCLCLFISTQAMHISLHFSERTGFTQQRSVSDPVPLFVDHSQGPERSIRRKTLGSSARGQYHRTSSPGCLGIGAPLNLWKGVQMSFQTATGCGEHQQFFILFLTRGLTS